MGKLGRKPLAPEEKRKHPITCRLTDCELDELRAKKPAKMRNGEYLRLAALARQINVKKIPAVNQELRVELGRVGNNINQIARALNSGIDVRIDRLTEIIIDLQRQIKIVRQELIG